MKNLPFHEALEDCSRLAGKVPQALCLDRGDFPVIGQGKQPVEGFTNDSDLVFRGELPVILFGDHTAAFKFVDRPFARGADGTKLFRPRTQLLDAKFAWHFLQTAKLPDTGYDRKTKYLENLKIPLPPLEEQRRIAVILDKAGELSDANRRRRDLLKAFPISLYKKMFGDPRRNSLHWPIFRLGEICLNEDARRVPVKSSDRKAMQGLYPYYGASGVIDYVDDYLFDGQRLLVGEDGANLIARSSPIAFIADGRYWVNNHAHVLGENGSAKLRFLEYYFALIDLKPFVTGSAQPKLTRSALDSLPVPLPPMDLQERFESELTAWDNKLAQAEISERQTSSLGSALRHVSFQGDPG